MLLGPVLRLVNQAQMVWGLEFKKDVLFYRRTWYSLETQEAAGMQPALNDHLLSISTEAGVTGVGERGVPAGWQP